MWLMAYLLYRDDRVQGGCCLYTVEYGEDWLLGKGWTVANWEEWGG